MSSLYRLASLYGQMPQPGKPIAVSPDTTLIDPNSHKVLYQGQGDAGMAVPGMTFNGMPVFRDKMGNLKDVRGNPIPQQGQQGTSAPAGALPGGLPAETQAYVPKVTAALGGQPPFDANGQPTSALLDAVQKVESGGNPQAVSPAGAQGPYQFMPATAASVGVTNPFDPTQARQGASKYLAQLYQQFGGDATKAIAAYNAGPGRVQQAMGTAPATGQTFAAPQGMPSTVQPTSGPIPQQASTVPAQTGLQYHPSSSGQVPSGYRFKADGSLEAIPGGPADTSANPDLTPAGAELVSVAGMQGYKLPISAIGTGKTGTKARIESVNDIAQKVASTGMDMETAVRNMRFGEAAQTASKDMSKRYGATWQNELAAAGQADIVLQEAKNIQQTDFQPINKFMVDWNTKTGSVPAQRFQNALLTFANEYAKVMSGSNNAGGATDSARAEAHLLLNKGFSNGQIEGTIALMKQEMRTRSQNQLDALQQQIANSSNFGNSPQQQTAPAQPSQQAPAGAVAYLKAHPETAAIFDSHFGKGASASVLQP
jgi:hypothetical protein